jgi:hypothetical protein
LKTDVEYEWPQNVKRVVPFFALYGPGCYLVVAAVLLFVGSFHPDRGWVTIVFSLMGFLAIVPAAHWLCTRRERAEQVQRFLASGDANAWPFLRQTDLEESRLKFA